MDDRGSRMAEALRRVELDLPPLAPGLWATLRGPADGDVLEALRATVAPMPLPVELEVLLHAHDGQERWPWWPTLECGPLLGAAAITEFVAWSRSGPEPWQWSPAWIAVAHEGWYQAALDAVPERSGTVLDASWPDRPRAVAPTLADAIDAAVDLARADLLLAPDDDAIKQQERRALLDELWRTEWASGPLQPRVEIDPGTWPMAWGGPQEI